MKSLRSLLIPALALLLTSAFPSVASAKDAKTQTAVTAVVQPESDDETGNLPRLVVQLGHQGHAINSIA